VHAQAQEEKFAADGFGVERYPVMYNDIRLIDPIPPALKAWKTWLPPSLSRATTDRAHIPLNMIFGRPAAIHLDRDKGPWYRSMG
jgi:tungstate transport system substrate-binding protein